MDIMSILLTPQVLGLSAGIIAVLYGIGKIPLKGDKTVGKSVWWRKVLPIVPLALGVAGAFTMGGGDTIETPVITGLWAGFVAAHGRKVVKRLLVDNLGGTEG